MDTTTPTSMRARLRHHPLRRLVGRLRPIAWPAAGAYGAMLVASGISLVVPLLLRDVVDAAIGERPGALAFLPDGLARRDRLLLGAAVIVGLAVVRGIVSFWQRYGTAWVGRTVATDLRGDLLAHLLDAEMGFHDKASVGQLMTRVTDDTEQVRAFAATGVAELANIAALLVGTSVLLWQVDAALAPIALAAIPIVAAMAVWAARMLTPRFRALQQARGGLSARLQESLTQVRIVQAFRAEDRTSQTYDDDNEIVFERRLGLARVFTTVFPAMGAVLGLSTALVLLVGGWRVASGASTVGTIAAFFSYIVLLGQPVRRLGFLLNLASRASASASRVFDLLDRPTALEPGSGSVPDDGWQGEVRWEGVGFGFGDTPVLGEVDLAVRPGEHVAVVGRSGSGKTALVSLLTRLYDPDVGRVTIDGRDVADLDRTALRRAVASVEQDVFLFSASLRDNVAFSRPEASDDEVVAAGRLAGVGSFVDDLPDGWETVIGDRGVTLSGGQRQRVALARALLVDAPVLVLDDAVSAVDARTEGAIRRALSADGGGPTTITVSQRLSTIRSADRIVVLDDGRIVERGTHDELVDAEGPYAALFHEALALAPDDAIADDLDDLVSDGSPTTDDDGTGEGSAAADEGDGAGGSVPVPHGDGDASGDDPGVAGLAPIRRVVGLLRPHRGALVRAGLLMLLVTGAGLVRPQLVEMAIDRGMRGGDASALRWAVAGFAVLVLVENVAGAVQRYTLIRTGVRVITDLRDRLFAHLLALGHAFHDRNRPGDLMARMTSDAETLSDFITWSVITTLQSVLTLVGIVVILLRQDVTLAVAAFTVVPLMAVATWRWTRATRARYERVRTAIGEVSARAEESLGGIRVVKGLRQEAAQRARFDAANANQRIQDLGTDRVSAAFYPVIDVLSDLAVAIVLGVGGLQVLRGALDPGALVAIILYVQQFFDPVRELTTRLDSVQDATAAGRRILEVLDTPVEIDDAPGAIDLPPVAGHVRLDGVRFRYDTGPEVLHGIDLDVPAGTSLALVGETGAGKTSIARLLGRFYDVDAGRVSVDGHDVRDVTLDSLRRQLAWVPQDVGLFRGTVRDNLRWGRPDATDEEVEAAARAVGAHDRFASLPTGYDTPLDEGGGGLSAGERQLVAFTRAVLMDPAVVILDEATANVDVATEAQMQRGLQRMLAGRTAVVIAHRLSTIAGADQIAVIDAGKVVERGSHGELLAAGGAYARLYTEQLAAEGVVATQVA